VEEEARAKEEAEARAIEEEEQRKEEERLKKKEREKAKWVVYICMHTLPMPHLALLFWDPFLGSVPTLYDEFACSWEHVN